MTPLQRFCVLIAVATLVAMGVYTLRYWSS
jgi:hypothetical protein